MQSEINLQDSRYAVRTTQLFLSALVILLLLFSVSNNISFAAQSLQTGRVIEVNDGDTVTLLINGTTYRARLIGIDAPEMGQRPWGRAAKEHLIDIMKQTDWTVLIETDIERHDKYNRLLTYLWTENHELINERMVGDGFAELFMIEPNDKYSERLSRAVETAQSENIGIWGPEGLTESPSEYRKGHPRSEEHTHVSAHSGARRRVRNAESEQFPQRKRESDDEWLPEESPRHLRIYSRKAEREAEFFMVPEMKYAMSYKKAEHRENRAKKKISEQKRESSVHAIYGKKLPTRK